MAVWWSWLNVLLNAVCFHMNKMWLLNILAQKQHRFCINRGMIQICCSTFIDVSIIDTRRTVSTYYIVMYIRYLPPIEPHSTIDWVLRLQLSAITPNKQCQSVAVNATAKRKNLCSSSSLSSSIPGNWPAQLNKTFTLHAAFMGTDCLRHASEYYYMELRY